MTKYETTFILEPGLDETRVGEEVDKVTQWIRDMGGEVAVYARTELSRTAAAFVEVLRSEDRPRPRGAVTIHL